MCVDLNYTTRMTSEMSIICRWYILDSPTNNKAKLYEGVATGDLMPCEVAAH